MKIEEEFKGRRVSIVSSTVSVDLVSEYKEENLEYIINKALLIIDKLNNREGGVQ